MEKDLSCRGSLLIRDVRLNGERVDILVDDRGMIAAVGNDVGRTEGKGADREIGGNGATALPGLVNTHTHAAMTLFRGYAEDMPLQEWLSGKIWPIEAHLTGDDVYRGTKLACLEMIRSGTVAFSDMYFFMQDAARAVAEMGLCAVLSYGFIDLFSEEKREAECRNTEEFVRFVKGLLNPRIKAAVGPHAVYTVSQEGLCWCAEYAASEGIGIHIHLSETEKEVTDAVAQWGKRPPAILDACGILTPRTVAAHCCWLDRDECTLLARRGVHVSHNPVSNMKLATGRAMPYHWLREAGAPVTLGTDSCASNNSLDLVSDLKFAALLQKFAWNSPTLLPAEEALAMATSAGARALGFGNGRIAPGEPADIILLDPRAVCNTPAHSVTSNVVYSCTGSAVLTTICHGSVLMHDRVVPGGEEIIREAARAARALVERVRET
ncbi:MAG: amidohydrolase family protein [Methanolinea sp.]|nr:amidohydrolase family protein [Methanolinea sp.]